MSAAADADEGWKALGLAAPARRALLAAGVGSLADLQFHARAQIARLHGMGPNALSKLDAALAAAGLHYHA